MLSCIAFGLAVLSLMVGGGVPNAKKDQDSVPTDDLGI